MNFLISIILLFNIPLVSFFAIYFVTVISFELSDIFYLMNLKDLAQYFIYLAKIIGWIGVIFYPISLLLCIFNIPILLFILKKKSIYNYTKRMGNIYKFLLILNIINVALFLIIFILLPILFN